jgi:uroporphyrinogen-III synthase
LKIKKILVSQPKPSSSKSPYFELAENHNVKIDFRKFIEVEGVPAKEFRKCKIKILEHSAVIFTSRTAVNHFFRVCKELRLEVPDKMKYFCISEATAYFLQKYIVYRKRKIFFGNNKFEDLMEIINKHKDENFLLPLSDIHKEEIPRTLDRNSINYSKAILYRTVSSNLSDIENINYDILVFYSPSGIKSLIQNFPDFEQNHTKIASFGPTTAKAVKEAGLRLDIQAPLPNAPSMTMALDQFIKKHNKTLVKKK